MPSVLSACFDTLNWVLRMRKIGYLPSLQDLFTVGISNTYIITADDSSQIFFLEILKTIHEYFK